MNKMTERVKMARDVLAQVDIKRLKIKWGANYITETKGDAEEQYSAYCWGGSGSEGRDAGRDAKVLTPENCEACVKGAMFIAAVDRHNELYLRDLTKSINNSSTCTDYAGHDAHRRDRRDGLGRCEADRFPANSREGPPSGGDR